MLPSDLTELYCNSNQIAVLPMLPSGLTDFACFNNQLDFADLEAITRIPPISYSATPQSYTISPAVQTHNLGANITINGTIGGSANQYQWYKNNMVIVGATNAIYTKANITSADFATYKCIVTSNYVGIGTTTGVTITSSEVRIQENCPVTITPATLPNSLVNVPYNQTMTQVGLAGTLVWAITSGNLPDGLSLDTAMGNITGTPTMLGTYNFNISVTDGTCIKIDSFTIIISASVIATQTITFNTLAPVTYGAVPFALVGNASSSLPVSYTSANTAVATVSGNTITIVGAGTTTITATQLGNSAYSAATPMTQQLTVLKKDLTVTAPNISLMPDCDGGRAGADPMPTTFVLTYTGFAYNETVVVLTTLPTTTTQYVAGRSARYLVIASGAQADNYNFVYVDGMITVVPCPFWRPTTTAGTTPNAIGDTSLEEWLSNQIKVYPNPSKADFNVDFGTLNLGKSLVRVYDAQGKTVFSSETEINNNTMKITLENMAGGLYLLEINSKKGRIIKNLVRE